MSQVIVFSGPTLSAGDVLARLPGAVSRGPAARGDIYRASLERPAAICLIDGYFEHRPAVTHKEILWAISRGVPVLGAASMGALRAAELHELGMIGCGAVFADLAAGRIEDDDEVAVVHAGVQHRYRAGSEAMVNLRATIAAALRAGVVSVGLADEFLRVAKQLFYPSRDYPRVLQELATIVDDRHALATLEAWLAVPSHRVDQKRVDALELLAFVSQACETRTIEQPAVSWRFPETHAFCRLRDEVECKRGAALSAAISEEIQLLGPETYSDIIASASLRALAMRLETEPDHARARRGVRGESFAEEEGRVLQRMPRVQALVLAEVESVLRALGDYERVAARAARKAELCASLGEPRPDEVAESVEAYFRDILRCEVPRDLAEFASSVGFSSVASFTATVRKEVCFLRKLSVIDDP
jgi:hypothetical protein